MAEEKGMGLGDWAAPIAAGAGLGIDLLTTDWKNRKQREQQQKLQDMQVRGQKDMGKYNAELAMDMWNKTNYGAQRKHMEDAGLNVGLMYSKGGGGGATTSAGSGGSVGSASAETPNIGMGMQMGLQAAQTQAQIELTKAQTNLTNVEAGKKGGVDTDAIKLKNIIDEYAGKEAIEQWKIKQSGRSEEQKTYSDELGARQGIANTIYELWKDGTLKAKGEAELESILKNNAKTDEQIKEIEESIELLKERSKGQSLDNIITGVEAKWADGSGFKSKNVADFVTRILGTMISRKMKQNK